MSGFAKLLNIVGFGVVMIIDEAPADRAFTKNLWSWYRPSEKSFEEAIERHLIKPLGFETYILTPHGREFQKFLKVHVEEEELVDA
jgi:hypothetical protein